MEFKSHTYPFFFLLVIFVVFTTSATAQIVLNKLNNQIVPEDNPGAIKRCRCYTDEFITISNTDPHFCLTEPVIYPDVNLPVDIGEKKVKYQVTLLVDDLATIFIGDTVMVNYTVWAPKTRVVFNYTGPCGDMKIRVANFSPRDRPFGGAGVGMLLKVFEDEFENTTTTYGTGASNIMQACAPGICSEPDAMDVIGMTGTGFVNPPDDCFPEYRFPAPNNLTGCDTTTWTPIRGHDLLAIFPLCEFVAMGRMGGQVINPVDGWVPNWQTYGIHLVLPFCQ